MLLHAIRDAVMDRIVDRGAGNAADLEQVAALGHLSGQEFDLLLAHFLEVDHHPIGAGFGDDAVERDHHDAGVAGLLDGAVQGVGRGRIDHDGVVALQDQVLDLRGLGRHFLVGRGEHVGGSHHLVGHRLLGHGVIALQHRLAPGIAGVIVGKGDLHVLGFGLRTGHGTHKGDRRRQQRTSYPSHVHPPVLGSGARLSVPSRPNPCSYGPHRPKATCSGEPARRGFGVPVASPRSIQRGELCLEATPHRPTGLGSISGAVAAPSNDGR